MYLETVHAEWRVLECKQTGLTDFYIQHHLYVLQIRTNTLN